MRLRTSSILTLLALVSVSAPAVTPALAAGPTGLLRVAYFSPDGPAVDVYLDGVRTLPNLVYKTVSSYQRVSAGSHTVEVRSTGSDPTSAALVTTTLTLAANAYQTVVAAGKAAQLTAATFTDGLSSPAAGKSQVRAMHFAPEVPAVDIAVRGGPVIFSNVAFPHATDYQAIGAGTYDLEFRAAGQDTVLLTAPGVAVTAGVVESLVGVGGVGRPIEVVAIQDAATAAAAGGAGTGVGATAWTRTALPVELLLLLCLAGIAVVVGRALRRAES